jgi:hypothetical protein
MPPFGEPTGQAGEPVGERDHIDSSEPVPLRAAVEQAPGGFRVVLAEEPETREILVAKA